MINTGVPYDGFEEMYPQTAPTPSWYGFGHKHRFFQQTPMRHLVLVDGQEHSEIVVEDLNHPLDGVIADKLRGEPAERPHIPTTTILTLNRTVRPGAREGLETGQFNHPDTRPAVIIHGRTR